MFITRGRVAIEQVQAAADSADPPVSLRIAARSAGTAVGSLAILTPDTAPTRLRAETEVEVLVLTETALDRLTDDHPAVAAALLHATTQAIAADTGGRPRRTWPSPADSRASSIMCARSWPFRTGRRAGSR